MKNNLKGLELVKELNSKRTQGEWKVRNEREVKLTYADGRVVTDGIEIDLQQEPSNRNIVTFTKNAKFKNETIANAQYTALAVNNFASVVDALNDLLEHCKFIPKETFTEDGKAHFQYTLNQAKEALNKIK
jgi:hypothetical protein